MEQQTLTPEKPTTTTEPAPVTKPQLTSGERELVFREIEASHASVNRITATLRKKYPDEPLLRHMTRALGAHENWLRALEENEGGEIKLLTGALHGEEEVIDATILGANGNGHEEAAPVEKKDPERYKRAHAQKKHHCHARDLGCKFSTHGNSYRRHEQLCALYQTRRLLDGGYQITSFGDFISALKKEDKDLPASAETIEKNVKQEHHSYSKLLRVVKQAMKKQKAKA